MDFIFADEIIVIRKNFTSEYKVELSFFVPVATLKYYVSIYICTCVHHKLKKEEM